MWRSAVVNVSAVARRVRTQCRILKLSSAAAWAAALATQICFLPMIVRRQGRRRNAVAEFRPIFYFWIDLGQSIFEWRQSVGRPLLSRPIINGAVESFSLFPSRATEGRKGVREAMQDGDRRH